jgi:hypothetical protein
MPSHSKLLRSLSELEPGIDNADFIPQIGFLIANDISARSLAVMGEGQKKSAEKFLNVGIEAVHPEIQRNTSRSVLNSRWLVASLSLQVSIWPHDKTPALKVNPQMRRPQWHNAVHHCLSLG